MDEQKMSFPELLLLGLYLGAMTYLLGLAYQLWAVFRQDKKIKYNALLVLVLTRLFTFATTFVIWINWTDKIDIMFGFILMPAFIPELIFSPLILKLFGYYIWRTSDIEPKK